MCWPSVSAKRNTVALCLFLYSGDGILVNMLSMVLSGMAIGVLICFLEA